jgi:hypothetical protein
MMTCRLPVSWSVFISLGALALFLLLLFYPAAHAAWDRSMTPYSRVADSDAWTSPQPWKGEVTVEALQSASWNPASSDPAPREEMTPAHVLMPSSGIQPVNMHPVTAPPTSQSIPTMMILPVMIHQNRDKAFSDLPVLLSTAISKHLSLAFQRQGIPYRIMNPLYGYDDLKEKGLDGFYRRLTQDYLEAGQPNEADLLYLADKLNTPTQRIVWVAFVTAELNLNQPVKPTGLGIPMRLLVDQSPRDINSFVTGGLHVYQVRPGIPLAWEQTATGRIRMEDFGNFTRSVFDDSDSITAFKTVTATIAHTLANTFPKNVQIVQTSLDAVLATPASRYLPSTIAPDDHAAFERILHGK